MHRITKLALALAAIAAFPPKAHAFNAYLGSFMAKYAVPANSPLNSCNTCHTSAGTNTYNPYGVDLRASIAKGIDAALTDADPKDSDGDRFANGVEARAGTFPGDASSFPAQAGAPAIAVAPASLSFGTVTVGSSAQQTVTVSNTGTADLAVSSVALCARTSSEFTASPSGPFTVAQGGAQTVTVTYAPADATADSGCVAIASNDAANPTVNVAVAGTGQAVQAPVVDVDISRFTVAKRLDISRGGTATPAVSVVNAGTVAVVPGTPTAVTVRLEGVDRAGAVVYTAADATLSLAPGATAKVKFPAFAPASPAEITWTLTVDDADPDVDVATAVTKVVP